jgi:putative tryptophan/tyrosine transport system substrate-binding protein
MNRRAFITGLGAAAWPLSARAQQTARPVVGFLSGRSAHEAANTVAAFQQGLQKLGYVDGQNVTVEFRWGDGRYDHMPGLVADLVQRQVAIIAAVGGSSSALAAKAATSNIPIVFITGDDPVKQGLVASLNRPGGNATGINIFVSEIEGKRLGLLRELTPATRVIGVLLNPAYPAYPVQLREVQQAAIIIGQDIRVVTASDEREMHRAFAALAAAGVGAVLVVAEPFFNSQREQLCSLAARLGIPAIYGLRDYAVAGGLMSYGTSLAEAYRQVGAYTGRILKGDKPAELPVVQSTFFELVINLKTAKALGIEVPPTLLARADEVIE